MRLILLVTLSAVAVAACTSEEERRAEMTRKAESAARLEQSMAKGRAMLQQNEGVIKLNRECREAGRSNQFCAKLGGEMLKAQEKLKDDLSARGR